eukprot:scaffold53887_cov57-Phaeocystis_antarctica.AAC.6
MALPRGLLRVPYDEVDTRLRGLARSRSLDVGQREQCQRAEERRDTDTHAPGHAPRSVDTHALLLAMVGFAAGSSASESSEESSSSDESDSAVRRRVVAQRRQTCCCILSREGRQHWTVTLLYNNIENKCNPQVPGRSRELAAPF